MCVPFYPSEQFLSCSIFITLDTSAANLFSTHTHTHTFLPYKLRQRISVDNQQIRVNVLFCDQGHKQKNCLTGFLSVTDSPVAVYKFVFQVIFKVQSVVLVYLSISLPLNLNSLGNRMSSSVGQCAPEMNVTPALWSRSITIKQKRNKNTHTYRKRTKD